MVSVNVFGGSIVQTKRLILGQDHQRVTLDHRQEQVLEIQMLEHLDLALGRLSYQGVQ
jgi:hypothetical protein